MVDKATGYWVPKYTGSTLTKDEQTKEERRINAVIGDPYTEYVLLDPGWTLMWVEDPAP